MRGTWSGLGLLLVVPWLAGCVSGPWVRLDTGQGAPLVYTPPESARLLAENGYDVEQNPPPKSNFTEPDYRINGEDADCYAPSTDNPRSVLDKVATKVNRGQADRIVLNLGDSHVTLEALKKELLKNPIADLKEIIVVKDGRIILFYP